MLLLPEMRLPPPSALLRCELISRLRIPPSFTLLLVCQELNLETPLETPQKLNTPEVELRNT